MRILAIETSCDDTGIAILEADNNGSFKVLSDIVSSQIEAHRPYGGIYPMLAKREHLKNLPITLKGALKQAKILNPKKEINLIAVTQGPGLEPCLWTGINFAKQLSQLWKIPIVPVNHIECHILVNFIDRPTDQSVGLPAIALVVSGGHTQLILVKGIGKYKILGETRDDAAGECFDKCAKILGLPYPGGPEIAKLATEARLPPVGGRRASVQLPRPMINTKDYDFSFSGLKTAVLYAWKKKNQDSKFFATRQKTYQTRAVFSAEIQQAIIDVLIKKTMRAVKDCKAKTLILGGGVSANKELRRQFAEKIKTEKYGFLPQGKKPYQIKLLVPSPNLSTDNAAMTAVTACFHQNQKINPPNIAKLKAQANLRISK